MTTEAERDAPLALRELARRINVPYTTVWGWTSHGIATKGRRKRVKLEHRWVGRLLKSSLAWYEEFQAALEGPRTGRSTDARGVGTA